MEKLELKHLAPYLPYGLRFEGKRKDWALFDSGIKILCPVDLDGRWEIIKPILRPLSDLTKDENFELYMDLCEEIGVIRCDSLLEALEKGNYYAIDIQKYHILEEWLNKNHFDWKFGLIEKGLAIDINTLNK